MGGGRGCKYKQIQIIQYIMDVCVNGPFGIKENG